MNIADARIIRINMHWVRLTYDFLLVCFDPLTFRCRMMLKYLFTLTKLFLKPHELMSGNNKNHKGQGGHGIIVKTVTILDGYEK